MTEEKPANGDSSTSGPRVQEIEKRYAALAQRACSAYGARMKNPLPYQNLQRKLNQLDRQRREEIAAVTGEPIQPASAAPVAMPTPTPPPAPLAVIEPEPAVGFLADSGTPAPAFARTAPVSLEGKRKERQVRTPRVQRTEAAAPAEVKPKAAAPAKPTPAPAAPPPAPKVVALPVAGFSLPELTAAARALAIELLRSFHADASAIAAAVPGQPVNPSLKRDDQIAAARSVHNRRVERLNVLQIGAFEKVADWANARKTPLNEARDRYLRDGGARKAHSQLEQIFVWLRAIDAQATAAKQPLARLYDRYLVVYRTALAQELAVIDAHCPQGSDPVTPVDDDAESVLGDSDGDESAA